MRNKRFEIEVYLFVLQFLRSVFKETPNDTLVCQGRNVTHFTAVNRDSAQYTPHDFSWSCFGKARCILDIIRCTERANYCSYCDIIYWNRLSKGRGKTWRLWQVIIHHLGLLIEESFRAWRRDLHARWRSSTCILLWPGAAYQPQQPRQPKDVWLEQIQLVQCLISDLQKEESRDL